MDRAGAEIYRLPEECVAYAISLTTPADACHSSAVSPTFKAAADSDAVWSRFLPHDHAAVLARSDEPVDCESKKELFSRLCNRPVLLDDATMSFGLDRRSGAKCFMLSARALSIVWGDDPACWIWTTSVPGSRFPEVVELVNVCWLEITGKLSLSLLSPGTTYAAYLVFALADDSYGLECNVGILPPKATVTVVSGRKAMATTTSTEHTICLQHMQGEEEMVMHRRKQQYMRLRKDYGRKLLTREADPDIKCPRRRGDGWVEVEMGEFAVAGDAASGEDGVVEVSLKEVDCRRWKRGLIVQGIDIRPRHTS
ncbi:putative F-box protein PP2-B12 [Phragmites australis]|uniref:putative F-box protein PP2-B12 n=1 Tax=Phragmites australis TaxID=29695 RepID=UPI002D76A61F|nr:putative F-box protein PP2-B12 [Phragmites australis]